MKNKYMQLQPILEQANVCVEGKILPRKVIKMSEYIVDYPQFEHLSIHEFVISFKEKIVRCRDCKHYDNDDAGCMYFVLTSNKLLHVNNCDGFCAWGERRES